MGSTSKRRVAAVKRIAEIDVLIGKKRNNRGSLEAADRDVSQEIRNLESEKKELERQVEGINQGITAKSHDGSACVRTKKQNDWLKVNRDDVEPRNARITAFEELISELLAEPFGAPAGDNPTVKQSDAEVDAFNELVKKYRLPNNLRIPEAEKLSNILKSDNEKATIRMRNLLKRLDPHKIKFL
jgi:hypothetical protein